MTQTTPERKPCGVCGKESSVNADGTIRHHITNNPDFQADPTPHTSNKCKGAGQPPAGAGAPGDTADGPQCRLCKHPVQLTGNGRVRSHLTPEATPRPCPAGSDFPLGVYPEIIGTTDGLVATLARDCGHVPAGECYGCYAARGAENCPDHGDPTECTCQAMAGQAQMMAERKHPWGVDAESVNQPTMADQLKAAADEPLVDGRTAALTPVSDEQADSRPQASRFTELLKQEAGNPGTVLDRLKTDPAHAAAVAVLEEPGHKHLDESGVEWVHPGPRETCPTPDCKTWRRIHPDGVYCEKCDTDNHRCPGCGEAVPHGTVACTDCDRDTEGLGKCTRCGEPRDGHAHDVQTDDAWRTPDDLMAKMSEEIRGMDALRFNCADCGHPITPLVDQFSFDGRAAVVRWVCEPAMQVGKLSCTPEEHECRPDCLVNVGDLEFGDHFVRRGVLMRCTSSGYGVVEAVVVEGPMKGRTGELKNPAEQVERTYCRHEYDHNGRFCDHCGAHERETTGQETTECTDDRTAAQRPRSSAAGQAAGQAAPAPAPGSKPPTPESAPTASQRSSRATSSEPTAKARTKDRNAAVTTDQDATAAAFLGNGRPAAPAVNGAANQAAAATQFLAGNSGAHGEVETKRDRFGRYLIPHPDTGKEQAWTRATTFAKSISDTYALGQWGLRMALLGATIRPDIVQRAHGKHVKADKQLLDELTADLKNAAGDKVAANLGTSMHSFTEMADRAWHTPGGPRSVLDQVPPDCRPMVETYIRLLEETGLEPVPHLIEFTTVVKQYGVAGTSDNCYKVTKPLVLKIGRAEVHLSPGEYVGGDKKTGKDLDYGWQEIAIQIALYVQGLNASGVWDRKDEKWVPDPLNGAKVRLDAGIVIHLPVDKEAEKQPAVYGLDLESGWNAAVLCERVRAWRKIRNLSSPVMVSEAPETFAPARAAPAVITQTNVRPPTLKDRANNVTSKSEASGVWADAKKQGMSDAEVDELVAVMQDRLRKLAEPGG